MLLAVVPHATLNAQAGHDRGQSLAMPAMHHAAMVAAASEISRTAPCHEDGDARQPVTHAMPACCIMGCAVMIATAAPVPAARLGTTTSSCGWCGTEAIDGLAERLLPLAPSTPIPLDVLSSMPERVRAQQPLFDATGAVHAAALFDATGEVLLVREDVGRHNAVDKVVGRLLLDGRLPATGLGMYVSGRASFELVQKTWAAGCSTLVAVSAPTSLAAHTARRAGLVLAGFVREDRLNVYSPERVGP